MSEQQKGHVLMTGRTVTRIVEDRMRQDKAHALYIDPSFRGVGDGRTGTLQHVNTREAVGGFLGSKRAEIRREHGFVRAGVKDQNLDEATRVMEATAFMTEWWAKPFVLEAPTTSRLDESLEAFRAMMRRDGTSEQALAVWDKIEIQSFLVEHNWLALIKDSPEFAAGEWKMPFWSSAFEFRVSGVHVIAICAEEEGTGNVVMRYAVRQRKRTWCFDSGAYERVGERTIRRSDGKILAVPADAKRRPDQFALLLLDNIKAASIMLDAKVAVANTLRLPHRSNQPRKEWKAPDKPRFSYHVIQLRKQARAPALPRPDGPPRWRVRLHFRRGHWRHYSDHKTWVNWMLVGDPDLGFVEHDYKL